MKLRERFDKTRGRLRWNFDCSNLALCPLGTSSPDYLKCRKEGCPGCETEKRYGWIEVGTKKKQT
jgi:hypothetical protein